VPETSSQEATNCALAKLRASEFLANIKNVSTRLWSGDDIDAGPTTTN